MAVQGLHVLNLSEIYRVAPGARSRANSLYMTAYFVGGAAGSAAAAVLYQAVGWAGVVALGLAAGAAIVAVWLAAHPAVPATVAGQPALVPVGVAGAGFDSTDYEERKAS